MARRGRDSLTEQAFFFVMTAVSEWTNVFVENRYCDIFIKYYQKRYQFSTLGYVLMPSHFHWIVEVKPKLEPSRTS